jgi:HK97 family phage major capsid protein
MGDEIRVKFRSAELTIEAAEKRLAEIEDEMKAIHEEAGEGDLDAEQRRTWEELDGEHEELAGPTRKAKRQQRLRESRAKWDSIQVGGRKEDPWDGDVRILPETQVLSRARHIVDDREIGGHLRADQKEQLDRLLRTRNASLDGDLLARHVIATQHPAYRSAFQKYASGSHAYTQEEAQAIERVRHLNRAASLSDTAGGFAVPVLIDPTIIMTAQGSTNDILRLARVETITTDVWKGVSSAGVTWKFDTEAAAATDNAPTIAQPTVTTRRADGFIPFSIEIGMDWPGFAESMSGLLAEGYDELLAEKLTTGTSGSTEPTGLITRLDANTTIETIVTTAGGITAAKIYDLWAALPQRFKRAPNCAWMSSTDVQNSIRQLGTVDPNFSVNITEEAIPRLFGRQYPMNDYMEDLPSGTGNEALLVVGDFRGYVVAQRAGMMVEFIPMLFDTTNNRPTGQRGWFAWARVGADVTTVNGFRLLVNKAS